MKTLRILSFFLVLFFVSSVTFAQTTKGKQGKKGAKTEVKKPKTNNKIGASGGPVPGQEIKVEQNVQATNKNKGKKGNSGSGNKSGTKND